jgi:hypothetical protein
MSPLRWDVVLVGFVLALPVLALGLRGDLTTEETVSRLPWCLAAGYAVVAVLRYASTPRKPATPQQAKADPVDPEAAELTSEHAPTP